MKPPKKLRVQPNGLLKFLKQLSGPSKSCDYWRRTFRKRMIEELQMKKYISSTVMFYKTLNQGLIDLYTMYGNNVLYAVRKIFQGTTRKTEKKFKCKKV